MNNIPIVQCARCCWTGPEPTAKAREKNPAASEKSCPRCGHYYAKLKEAVDKGWWNE